MAAALLSTRCSCVGNGEWNMQRAPASLAAWARPRRWELRRIPLQKTDMTDKTVISDDPDDDVDDLQRHSQFAESNDSDREERDKNPASVAEQGIGPWRERI